MTRAEVCEFFRAHTRFVILTHRRPDGDTIGCAAALCMGLRQLGKDAWVLQNRQFTARFAPYLEGLVCAQAPQDAVLVAVDIAAPDLIMLDAETLGEKIALAIDHHESNRLSCPRLVEADKAACGEIIYALLLQLGLRLTPALALPLYIAVSTDTGCFKYSNTSANTLRVAADLVETGADVAAVNKLFFDTKSLSRLKLEARLVEHMELYAGGRVAIMQLPRTWIQELGITEDDIDSISGFARSIEGVQIGVTIREVENGRGKLSVRTDRNYNASEICALLGGGGHAAAAGASVPGGIEGAHRAIVQALGTLGVPL